MEEDRTFRPAGAAAGDAAGAKDIMSLLQEVQASAAAREEHDAKRERELELAEERFRAERKAWEDIALEQSQALSRREEELARLGRELAAESDRRKDEVARLARELAADYDKCKEELSRQAEAQAPAMRKDEIALLAGDVAAQYEKCRKEISRLADNLAADYKKKQLDLQGLKRSLQAELAELVRQAQANSGGAGA
jgi:hypothetical protein